jgi:hypothetical protein
MHAESGSTSSSACAILARHIAGAARRHLQDARAAVGDLGITNRPDRLLSKGRATLVAARDYLHRPMRISNGAVCGTGQRALHNPVLIVPANRICGSQGA